MNAIERFDGWMTGEVGPELRSRGFTKRGSTFHLRGEGAWGVINFQKSQFGSRDAVRFYVNVAVALDRLLARDGLDPTRKPPAYKCNWQVRIGRLSEPAGPESWDVHVNTDFAHLTRELIRAIDQDAIPFIQRRASESRFASALETETRPDSMIHPPAATILGVLEARTSSDIRRR